MLQKLKNGTKYVYCYIKHKQTLDHPCVRKPYRLCLSLYAYLNIDVTNIVSTTTPSIRFSLNLLQNRKARTRFPLLCTVCRGQTQDQHHWAHSQPAHDAALSQRCTKSQQSALLTQPTAHNSFTLRRGENACAFANKAAAKCRFALAWLAEGAAEVAKAAWCVSIALTFLTGGSALYTVEKSLRFYYLIVLYEVL